MRNISTVPQFVETFGNGEPVTVSRLCGRVIRGKRPEDFETLTNDPTRKVVLIMGPDGLQQMVRQPSGYAMLETIGYAKQHIAAKVSEGNAFKLAVFPEGNLARPATWSNMFAMLSKAYGMQHNFEPYIPVLQRRTFEEITQDAPFDYHQVTSEGISNPHYMTPDRFAASRRTLRDVRDLAYFTGSMRQQFGGNAKVLDEAGNETMDEYAVYNLPLAKLGEYALLDIDVSLPRA
jgi:hypothetical protein